MILSSPSSVLGGDWLKIGAQVLGGLMGGGGEQSSAGSASGPAQLNTSGWVVGEGDASGGTSGGILPDIPWWVWVGGGILTLFIAKKAR